MANSLMPLTRNVKAQLEGKGYVLKCFHCGKDLEVKDSIVSKRASNYKAKLATPEDRRYYHKDCWDSLFF